MRPNLKVFCSKDWIVSSLLTTFSIPVTCPPVTMKNFDPFMISADIVYIRLHAVPSNNYLYGEAFITAMSFDQIAFAPEECFSDSVIFLEGCYGMEISEAFFKAGAKAVIGNIGPTYGHPLRRGPSSVVGYSWLRNYRRTKDYKLSLERAIPNPVGENYKGWVLRERKQNGTI